MIYIYIYIYIYSCMIYLSSKICRKLITFFVSQYLIFEKYDHDNNQKLQSVGLIKNSVLQVLTSWEN